MKSFFLIIDVRGFVIEKVMNSLLFVSIKYDNVLQYRSVMIIDIDRLSIFIKRGTTTNLNPKSSNKTNDYSKNVIWKYQDFYVKN